MGAERQCFMRTGIRSQAVEKLRLQRYAACLRDQRIECQTAPQFFQPRLYGIMPYMSNVGAGSLTSQS